MRQSASSRTTWERLCYFAWSPLRCALTRHPDPTTDRLLRSDHSNALEVLADHVLERGTPLDPLLADRLGAVTTTAAGDADVSELETLWAKAAELCPLVEAIYPPRRRH